jgi:hypothetical protein
VTRIVEGGGKGNSGVRIDLPMVTRTTDDRSYGGESALGSLAINALRSSTGDTIAMLDGRRREGAYGRQHEGHHHRRNRPYTFRSCKIRQLRL